MNSYQWTCPACQTPNALFVDNTTPGQVALNCKQCGEPGLFEKDTGSVLHYELGEPFPTGMSTCSTSLMSSETSLLVSLETTERLGQLGTPRTGPDPTIPTEEDLEYKRSHDEYIKLAYGEKNAKKRRWFWQTDR